MKNKQLENFIKASTGNIFKVISVTLALLLILVSTFYIGFYLIDGHLHTHKKFGYFQKIIFNTRVSLLEMQKNEKNFLYYLDYTYADAYELSHQKVKSSLYKIIDHDSQQYFSFSAHKAQDVVDAMARKFQNIVAEQQKVGFSEISGLSGKLRKSIHNVEDKIKDILPLYVQVLKLRRHEKDFFIRNEQKYIERFRFQYKDYLRVVRESQLDPKLRDDVMKMGKEYYQTFLLLSESIRTIDILQDEISDLNKNLMIKLNQMANLANRSVAQGTHKVDSVIFFIKMITALISVLGLLYIGIKGIRYLKHPAK